jgi:hypothetical protein
MSNSMKKENRIYNFLLPISETLAAHTAAERFECYCRSIMSLAGGGFGVK